MNGTAMNGNEMFAKAIREEFVKAFPNMRYVEMETAFGGYPVAAVGFADGLFVIKLALSGYSRDDVRVSVTDTYEIEVTTNESNKTLFEPGIKTAFSKMKMSKFRRRYPLPQGADSENIRSTMDDGVLTVRVPVLNKAVATVAVETSGGKG